ncbi:MAG TPA: glycosyltransferase family 39 protein, partial [Thermoanaerobaculia bacterium]|nr:glycosyltransferase family 39 protein [Thermoanaerobaculia bacterium]
PAATETFPHAAPIYDAAGGYMKGVARSRRGNLLFLIAAVVGVFLWAIQLAGPAVALIAAAIFASLPAVLAHAGVATTDTAGVAAFALSMAAMHYWLEVPSWRRTFLLAAAIGVGLVSKFSFPLFFAIGAVVMMLARRRFPLGRGAVAHLLAFVIVWGVYGWEHRRLARTDPRMAEAVTSFFGTPTVAERVRLPASRFFAGLFAVQLHNREGHGAFLLGELRTDGWWYYFPVAVAVKTPLPALALAAAGIFLSIRRRAGLNHIALIAAALLASTMTSRINIGVRHVLPLYAPMAILASYAVVELCRARYGRFIAAALCAWLAIGSALAHPDYLPWMNALAGNRPQQVLLDSNFDWGQDIYRLTVECRKRGIHHLNANLFGTADYNRLGMPTTGPIDPHTASPGWYALSEGHVVAAQVHDPSAYRWLTEHYRFDRVGKTIRLYRVP